MTISLPVPGCKLCAMGVKEVEPGLSHNKLSKHYDVAKSSVQRHIKHVKKASNTAAEGTPPARSRTDEGSDLFGDSSYVVDDSLESFMEQYGVSSDRLLPRAVTFRDPSGHWLKYGIVENAEKDYEDIDATEILNKLDRSSYYDNPAIGGGGGTSAFVLSINDVQVGKAEGGGTDETIKRVHRFIGLAKKRIEELRLIGRDIDTLVIIGGGDILEGCFIYPNQVFNIDRHRHDQIVDATSLILYAIDNLAPMFDRVQMLVTKGNHGENRVDGRMTHTGDNDDTLVFKMAKNATDRDPALSHLEWTIADGAEEFVMVDVAETGWTLGTTHGDVYGKTNGTANSKKVWEWYKNMRAGHFAVGSVDVLITHHFHHEESADFGSVLWHQTPAQDGGSHHFESITGQYSESGMLTFVMTPDQRYQDEMILR